MCAKFAYALLAAFFVFVVGTIAAFVYLDWWQALLVSLAIFVTLIYGAPSLRPPAVPAAFGGWPRGCSRRSRRP